MVSHGIVEYYWFWKKNEDIFISSNETIFEKLKPILIFLAFSLFLLKGGNGYTIWLSAAA
jgi:hypothetical protein